MKIDMTIFIAFTRKININMSMLMIISMPLNMFGKIDNDMILAMTGIMIMRERDKVTITIIVTMASSLP